MVRSADQRKPCFGKQQGSSQKYLRVLERARLSNAHHQCDPEHQHGYIRRARKEDEAPYSGTIANAQQIQHRGKQQSQARPQNPDPAGVSSGYEQAYHNRQEE